MKIPLYFGLSLLLYFLLVLITGIASIIKTIKLWNLKKAKIKDFLFGFLLSLSLFAFLYIYSWRETRESNLIFTVPVIMLFLPYILHRLILAISKENYISKVIVISTAFTTVGMIFRTILFLY